MRRLIFAWAVFAAALLISQTSPAVAAASSAFASSQLNLFENVTTITQEKTLPPLLPQSAGALTPSPPLLRIWLKDAQGRTISTSHVLLQSTNKATGDKTSTLQLVHDGHIDIARAEGSWTFFLAIDEVSELGSDYITYLDAELSPDTALQEHTPPLLPVGSVRGQTYDPKNRLVSNAKIRIECRQYLQGPAVESDEFGSFFAEYLAPGACTISALSDKTIGFSQITIEAGKTAQLKIVLQEEVAQNPNSTLIGGSFILLLLALMLVAVLRKTKPAPNANAQKEIFASLDEEKETAPATELEETGARRSLSREPKKVNEKRMDAILKTLSDRERKIAEFLLNNNFVSTQAKIKYAINVPKTSLIRTLAAMAERNIIEIKKEGKAKKIRIAPWLLEGENKAKREWRSYLDPIDDVQEGSDEYPQVDPEGPAEGPKGPPKS